jgi:hypothetical protein
MTPTDYGFGTVPCDACAIPDACTVVQACARRLGEANPPEAIEALRDELELAAPTSMPAERRCPIDGLRCACPAEEPCGAAVQPAPAVRQLGPRRPRG